MAFTDTAASKVNAYAVLRTFGEAASKLNAYAVMQTYGEAVAKLNAYAVITPAAANAQPVVMVIT